MAEITAKLVNELRAKTGQGMMECKKMLTQTGGDMDKAVDEFRKKGVKSSLTERTASEGRVAGVLAADGKSGALVELNCNTDFTAKSEPFLKLAAKAAKLLLHNPTADMALAGEVNAEVTEVAQTTGENIRVGKTAHLSNAGGRVGLYLYGITGKIGVLVSLHGDPSDELLNDIGMHVTAARPLAGTREELPADLVAKERELAVEQARASGKPQNIAEKIAEGKMRTFYEERVLLDQQFIKSDKFKGSINELLKKNGCTFDKYVRIEVGQQ